MRFLLCTILLFSGFVSSLDAQSVRDVSLYIITSGDKSGYIDRTGKVVIGLKFDGGRYMLSDFSEGLAEFKDMKALSEYPFSKEGYMDTTGKIVIKPQFDVAYDFSDGRALVKVGDLEGFIDKTGKQVIKLGPYQAGRSFKDGLAAIHSNFEFWYIDVDGRIVIPKKQGLPKDFSEGLACVYLPVDGKLKAGYIDKTGKTIIQPQFDDCSDFSEGLAEVEIGGRSGYVDRSGTLVIQPKFKSAYSFKDGRARVSTGDKYGFIDAKGRLVIPEIYDVVTGDFSEGFAAACRDHKCGYIDVKGSYIIPPKFDSAYDFRGGVAKVQNPYKIGYIDRTGKYIWQPTI